MLNTKTLDKKKYTSYTFGAKLPFASYSEFHFEIKGDAKDAFRHIKKSLANLGYEITNIKELDEAINNMKQ